METNEGLYVASRKKWREWLKGNHGLKKEVWLIFYRKYTGKPCISYDDAVEEALCFGWIDSIVKRVDDERYVRKFTPRKSESVWSEANKRRVKKLMQEGRMAEAGLTIVNEAKKSGEWPKKRVRKELIVPAFMKAALAANKKASKNFNKLAPSYRRNMVGWVVGAKMEETRKRRLEESIRLLERGENLGMK